MDASDDTPRTGENVSEAQVDYQKLGQKLLERELERHAYEIRERFTAVDGADLDVDTLHDLEEVHRRAGFLLQVVRECLNER